MKENAAPHYHKPLFYTFKKWLIGSTLIICVVWSLMIVYLAAKDADNGARKLKQYEPGTKEFENQVALLTVVIRIIAVICAAIFAFFLYGFIRENTCIITSFIVLCVLSTVGSLKSLLIDGKKIFFVHCFWTVLMIWISWNVLSEIKRVRKAEQEQTNNADNTNGDIVVDNNNLDSKV